MTKTPALAEQVDGLLRAAAVFHQLGLPLPPLWVMVRRVRGLVNVTVPCVGQALRHFL